MPMPSNQTTHPSYLELDRHHLRGSPPESAALREHLRSCARCTAYLSSLRTASPQAAPDWLRGLAGSDALAPQPRPAPARPPSLSARRQSRWHGAMRILKGARAARVALVSLSAAAALLFYLRSRPFDRQLEVNDRQTLREKGAPAVAVYLKRAERVWQWDGSSSVRPGDLLRLKIIASGYEHVVVGAPAPAPQHLRLLYSGKLERGETFLPTSWEIDAQPGPEQLYVFLSRQPMTTFDLLHPTEKSAGGAETGGAVWQKHLLLRKSERELHAP